MKIDMMCPVTDLTLNISNGGMKDRIKREVEQ